MTKPKTNTHDMAIDLARAVSVLRQANCMHEDDIQAWADAMATVETFCAVALRIIAKTHPAKVREEARLVEIQSHIAPGNRVAH